MVEDATGKGFLLSRQSIKRPIIASAANSEVKQKAFLAVKAKSKAKRRGRKEDAENAESKKIHPPG